MKSSSFVRPLFMVCSSKKIFEHHVTQKTHLKFKLRRRMPSFNVDLFARTSTALILKWAMARVAKYVALPSPNAVRLEHLRVLHQVLASRPGGNVPAELAAIAPLSAAASAAAASRPANTNAASTAGGAVGNKDDKDDKKEEDGEEDRRRQRGEEDEEEEEKQE